MTEIAFTQYPIRGIDTSQYNVVNNKQLDYTKAKDNGAMYVYIRSSYGIVEDEYFKESWTCAKGVLPRRAYHYMDYYSHTSMNISDEEWGRRQARFVWNLIKDDNDDSIIFLDVESSSIAPKIETVMPRVVRIMAGFYSEIDRLMGKMNGLYTSLSYLQYFVNGFGKRPVWVAWYNEEQTPLSVISITRSKGWIGEIWDWQYASDGDIGTDSIGDGIRMGMGERTLDLNIWLRTEAQFKASFSVPTEPIPPDPEPEENTRLVKVMTVMIDGTRIRNKPTTTGSIVLGYLPIYKIIDVLDTVIEGQNIWARIGIDQYCALINNGTVYLV